MKSSAEIYAETGTFAPLVNRREYTEDEKTVLLHFFTNIDKNVYCATDNMSSQLWAFFVGQYSRTDMSMRDRFLQLFSDAEKSFAKGQITADEYVPLSKLAESIRAGQFKTIQYFSEKASGFLKKWGVDHGHNSLKDADRIRFAVEGVSQVFTKVIESPFPALGDFQEKSTRYMHFGKESIIYSPKLMASEFGNQVKEMNDELMELYEKQLPLVKEILVKSKIINKEDFQRESAFERTLEAKAFDIVRYILPSGLGTCLGASFSARTCEHHISEMLSHPLEEVRAIAKSMHNEALKLSAGLLSHVEVNDYLISKRENTEKLVDELFTDDFKEIKRGIKDSERVTLISENNIDNKIISSILFENGRTKGISFKDCQTKVESLSEEEKDKIIGTYLDTRGKFDRMPRALQHGTVLFEFLCDFGAYRDFQRHRASPQMWQGATAIHGYDYPEYIDLEGMQEFKKEYDFVMTKLTNLSRKIIKKYPHEAEYVGSLGHLIRTTFEMHPGQIAYVCELRTTPQGHHSYRNLFKQVYRVMEERAPLFMKHVRVCFDEEGTRQKQEERSAERREKLGLD